MRHRLLPSPAKYVGVSIEEVRGEFVAIKSRHRAARIRLRQIPVAYADVAASSSLTLTKAHRPRTSLVLVPCLRPPCGLSRAQRKKQSPLHSLAGTDRSAGTPETHTSPAWIKSRSSKPAMKGISARQRMLHMRRTARVAGCVAEPRVE